MEVADSGALRAARLNMQAGIRESSGAVCDSGGDCGVAQELSDLCISRMRQGEPFLADIQRAHGDEWPIFTTSFFYFFLCERMCADDAEFWAVFCGLLRREENAVRLAQFGGLSMLMDALPGAFEHLCVILSCELGVTYFLNGHGIECLYEFARDGYECYFLHIAEVLRLISKQSFEYFTMMDTSVLVIYEKLFGCGDIEISKKLLKSIKNSLKFFDSASAFFCDYLLKKFDYVIGIDEINYLMYDCLSIVTKKCELKDLHKIVNTGIELIRDDNVKMIVSFNEFFKAVFKEVSHDLMMCVRYFQKIFILFENAKYEIRANSMEVLTATAPGCPAELQEELLNMGQLNVYASFLELSLPIELLKKIFISASSVVNYLQITQQTEKYSDSLYALRCEIEQQNFALHPHFDIHTEASALIAILNSVSGDTFK